MLMFLWCVQLELQDLRYDVSDTQVHFEHRLLFASSFAYLLNECIAEICVSQSFFKIFYY